MAVSSSQLKRLHDTNSIAAFYHLELSKVSSIPTPNNSFSAVILSLLRKFEVLFQEPQGLPPVRSTSHRIHLLLSAAPVNVKPYRYPYFRSKKWKN